MLVLSKSGSSFNDRYVCFNYQDGTWVTGSLSRTTWADANLYDKPYATEFTSTGTHFSNNTRCNKHQWIYKYYAHEVGVDNVDATGAKPAFQLLLNLEILV